jgi:hypothetical protein
MIEIPAGCEGVTGSSLVGLKYVTVSEGNVLFVLRDDFLMNVKVNKLIRYFGREERILIKNFIEVISEGCFSGCTSLCEVTFESDSKLREIGEKTFYACAIQSIRIPSEVEIIGDQCFSNCQSLSEVTFESNCKMREIGKYAFSGFAGGCPIQSIRIPNNVEVIGEWCFSWCESLCDITFDSDSKLREIGEKTFYRCPIQSIQIPMNVEVIGDECFSQCNSLREVSFDSGSKLKELGQNAFNSCPLECVRVPERFGGEYDWPKQCRNIWFRKSEKMSRSRTLDIYGIVFT